MIEEGMDVARMNFSHGSHEDHGRLIEAVRKAASSVGRPVAVLQDLAGAKVRVGTIDPSPVHLKSGRTVVLTTESINGNEKRFSVNVPTLPQVLKQGDPIMLADGRVQLEVRRIEGAEIECRVTVGGPLSSRKGLNLPTRSLDIPALTEKDLIDLEFGVRQGVDYVAVSFVRTAQDLELARQALRRRKADTPLIAKIEKHEALEVLGDIADAADGLMVARGDLGVEIPVEQVPLWQKRIIATSRRKRKPVITATQMLRSMVDQPVPTRAEVSDVATAVMQGTDAVMLSEETTIGQYPVEAVRVLRKVIEASQRELEPLARTESEDLPVSIAAAACSVAVSSGARAIVVPSQSGASVRRVASNRPAVPIIALSPNRETVQRLALVWGVEPFLTPALRRGTTDIEHIRRELRRLKVLPLESQIVITAGWPFRQPGNTNLVVVTSV
jgi:pyruvate kinase